MKNTVDTKSVTLKIQELHSPYGAVKTLKGRLFVATPTKAKPRDVTAESWREQIVEATRSSWNQHLAIPFSFWHSNSPYLTPNARDQLNGECHCIHVMDIFCGIEKYH